jgi:flagellar motility protein MotE (MotC chaperone)
MRGAGQIIGRLRVRSAHLGLLPVVTLALGGFLVLKVAHISLGTNAGPMAIATADAQEKAQDAEATPEPEAPEGDAAQAPAPADDQPATMTPPATATAIDDRPAVPTADAGGEAPRFMTRSEIEVLNRLTQRRKEIERHGRDLELREVLLKAAEKRVEAKLVELKQIETRIEATFSRQEEEKNEQFQSLVGMYENMKPKEAARIFDTLDMDILLSVVEQMRGRKMAPILASMNPEVAQRLTVELAARASGEITSKARTLPAIADRDPG